MSVQPRVQLRHEVCSGSRSTALAHEVGTVLDVADRGVDGLGSISNQTNEEVANAMGRSSRAGLPIDNMQRLHN
jgi:hypothetical protein